MLLQTRCYWHPKDLGHVKEYEDAFCWDPQGVVAIADGVSSAIFSRQWAEILTKGIVQDGFDGANAEGLKPWLTKRRAEWAQSINLSSLNFFQQQKLQDVGGAYATLLWIKLTPLAVEGHAPGEYRLEAHGLGDCCVFVVRGGEIVWRFPLEKTAEFDADPLTLCSRNRNRDGLAPLKSGNYEGQVGDLVVLSSDALAKWIFQRIDAQEQVRWDELWQMDCTAWAAKVTQLRELPLDVKIRVDDTTLLMLQTAPQPGANSAAAAGAWLSSSIAIISPHCETASMIADGRIVDSQSATQIVPVDEDEELIVAELIEDLPCAAPPIESCTGAKANGIGEALPESTGAPALLQPLVPPPAGEVVVAGNGENSADDNAPTPDRVGDNSVT